MVFRQIFFNLRSSRENIMPSKNKVLDSWHQKKNSNTKLTGGLTLSPIIIVELENSELPSRELTYPTLGKGKSSSKVPWDWIC